MEAIAKELGSRTGARGRTRFNNRRTNCLKATIHWAQDFRRISRAVLLDPAVIDEATFKAQIETAKQRAAIRENLEESDGLTKAADPGKFKKQKEWIAWSRGLKNYLSAILGQDGVPLSCVICDEVEPDCDLEQEDNCDFEQLRINCAPLSGLFFETDPR